MSLRYLLDDWFVEDGIRLFCKTKNDVGATTKTAIGSTYNLSLFAELNELRLSKVRVHLILNDSWLDLGVRKNVSN